MAPTFPLFLTEGEASLNYEIELLIFDLDGTLVDTRRDLANAVNYALQQTGRSVLPLEVVVSYVGDGLKKLLERALGRVAEAEAEIVRQHFRQYYFEHIADFSRPYAGTVEILEHFAAKKKAVLTNKPQEFSDKLLERLGICKYFEMVVGGQADLPLKPEPEGLVKILQHLAIQPSRAAIIGDSENDILAGKAAGAFTGAATYGFRPLENLLPLHPDFLINHPVELKNYVI